MTSFFSFSIFFFGYDQSNFSDLDRGYNFLLKALEVSVFPIVLFAFSQFLFSDNILSLNSEDKILQPKSELLGSFRPRSIFNSSYELGLFCGIPLIFSLSRVVSNDSYKKWDWLVFILSLLGVLLSQTRNVILVYFLCSLTLIWLKKSNLKSFWVKVIPFVWLAVMTTVFIYVSVSALGGDFIQNILSGESSVVRLSFLYTIFDGLVLKSNIVDWLFGWGLMQHSGDSGLINIFPEIYNSEDGALGIDNTLVAMFLQFGLMGVILFLLLYTKLWQTLIHVLNVKKSANFFAITSFFSVYIAAGVFNVIQIGFWHIIIWFLAITMASNNTFIEATERTD